MSPGDRTRQKVGIDRLRSLTRDNGSQQTLIASLERQTTAKMDELRETISLRRDRGLNAAIDVVLTNRGRDLMREIRRLAAESVALEDRLLAERVGAAQAAVRSTFSTFTPMVVVSRRLPSGEYCRRNVTPPLIPSRAITSPTSSVATKRESSIASHGVLSPGATASISVCILAFNRSPSSARAAIGASRTSAAQKSFFIATPLRFGKPIRKRAASRCK